MTKKKSKSNIMNNDTNKLTSSDEIIKTTQVTITDMIPLTMYNNLAKQYDMLTKENNVLKDKLIEAGSRYQKMEDDISELRKANTDLLQQIEILKKENDELKKLLKERDNEIKSLKVNMDILMKERQERLDKEIDHENIMVTAESIMDFEKIYSDFIVGNSNHAYKLSHIIYNTNELDEEQWQRYQDFEKEIGCDAKTLLYYLTRLKTDRHFESHEKYRNPELTVDQIKTKMINYVKMHKEDKYQHKFEKIINIVIKKIEKESGTNPFKHNDDNAPDI